MEDSLEFTPEDRNRGTFVYMQEIDPNGKRVKTKTLNGRTLHYVE
jgi:hypothetical protein